MMGIRPGLRRRGVVVLQVDRTTRSQALWVVAPEGQTQPPLCLYIESTLNMWRRESMRKRSPYKAQVGFVRDRRLLAQCQEARIR